MQYSKKDLEVQTFDNQLFGYLLKKTRIDHGYRTAQALCDQIKETTGVSISDQIMYRIEKCTRPLTLDQSLALSLTLFGEMYADKFMQLIALATPKKWLEMDELEQIAKMQELTGEPITKEDIIQ